MNRMAATTGIVLFLLTLMTAGAVCADEAPEKPAVILKNDLRDSMTEFENFRTCLDEFRDPPGTPPSRKGLSTLTMSGSSEFSKKGLEKIKKIIPSSRIMIVDLREESHGFINDRPVSWKNERNNANKGKSLEQITKSEKESLKEAKELDSAIKTAYTEEALCREMGVEYARFPVTDHSRPDDPIIDRFVTFTRSLPPGTWVHFHCKAGAGRTTTFMAMYDMIRNAGEVSCDDIIARQYLMGGLDLSGKETKGDAWFDVLARERDSFVKSFYDYCRACGKEFKEPWSRWSSN